MKRLEIERLQQKRVCASLVERLQVDFNLYQPCEQMTYNRQNQRKER
jgi:hypothetical protein